MTHKKRFFEKRIPTLAALIILIISLVVTSFLLKSGVIIIGRASPDTSPQNILITNISDISFSVTFTTNEKTTGAVNLLDDGGKNSLFFDERDKSGAPQTYYSHEITVGNLKPQKNYNFYILADGKTVTDNDKPFTVTTGLTIISSPSMQHPIFGKVFLPDGQGADDILVRIPVNKTQSISTITKSGGEFIIPSNSIRNDKLDSYYNFLDTDIIQLEILRQDMRSTVKILFKNSPSIPLITLPNIYDFTQENPGEVATSSSKFKIPQVTVKTGEVKITSPGESQSLIDNKPLFKGTAGANKEVKITIESPVVIQGTVTADANGLWTFRPQTALAPGNHTITIETTDNLGIARKISLKFSVFASGSQLALEATGAPTPTTTPTATPTPTSVLSSTPTLAPSVSPSLTPSVSTPTATIIPTAVPTLSPTAAIPTKIPKTTLPPSGTTSSSIILTFVSVVFIFTGVSLLLIL